MVIKNIIILFFSCFVISCSNLEFVYDYSKGLNNLNKKTSLTIEGDSANIINAYISSKIITKDYNKAQYLLRIISEKTSEASVIEKDATASKYNIKYEVDYIFKNIKEKCIIVREKIITEDTYDSKSAGYSFGSDLSEKSVSTNILQSNIDMFLNNTVLSIDSFSCKKE